MSPSGPGNRFGVDYRGVRGAGNSQNKSGSRDRIPKINNYTRPTANIASNASPSGGVFDRLYGRSLAGRSGSRDKTETTQKPPSVTKGQPAGPRKNSRLTGPYSKYTNQQSVNVNVINKENNYGAKQSLRNNTK